jgi:hypothetical protein
MLIENLWTAAALTDIALAAPPSPTPSPRMRVERVKTDFA